MLTPFGWEAEMDNICQHPIFHQPDPRIAQGEYAVKILLNEKDQSKFPIGTQGTAAIARCRQQRKADEDHGARANIYHPLHALAAGFQDGKYGNHLPVVLLS
jgi:hypothetical protein